MGRRVLLLKLSLPILCLIEMEFPMEEGNRQATAVSRGDAGFRYFASLGL